MALGKKKDAETAPRMHVYNDSLSQTWVLGLEANLDPRARSVLTSALKAFQRRSQEDPVSRAQTWGPQRAGWVSGGQEAIFMSSSFLRAFWNGTAGDHALLKV